MSTDIRYPGELPLWLAEGHSFIAVDITEDATFEQGEVRPRQIHTWAPQVVNVSALFTQTQYDRWCDFYEDELEAGTRSFDTRVAHQSGGVVEWWTAQIIAPPLEVTLHKGPPERQNRYRVTLQLMLLEGPFDSRTATTLRGRSDSVVRLEAIQPIDDGVLRGRDEVVTTLAGRLGGASIRGRITVTTTLTGEIGVDNLLLEDGDDLLLEDGGQLLLE